MYKYAPLTILILNNMVSLNFYFKINLQEKLHVTGSSEMLILGQLQQKQRQLIATRK